MKILLVEDSERLRRSLSMGLCKSGYAVDRAIDGEQAVAFTRVNAYDVIILDLMLPKIDGLEVLSILRRQGNNTHVLILSAKDKTEDRIRGLNLGADDYLVKPFSFDELQARIRALIRRQTTDKAPVLEFGPVQIDSIACQATCNGKPLSLTPHEFTLLEYMVRRRGQVFSHDQLINRLYDAETHVSKNAIEAHISQIRKKLKQTGAIHLLKTKRGFGYFISK